MISETLEETRCTRQRVYVSVVVDSRVGTFCVPNYQWSSVKKEQQFLI